MALKNREKLMTGGLLMAGSLVGLGLGVAWPAWQAVNETGAKIQGIETDIAQLKQQETVVQTDISRYNKNLNLPEDLVIRQFTPETQEKNVKEMLDQVIALGTRSGNNFISLAPAAAPVVPPSTTADPAKTNPKQPANNGLTQPLVAQPAAAPSTPKDGTTTPGATTADSSDVNLKRFGYELAFRGNYDNIVNFLTALNRYHELVEVTSVEVLNESGPQRQAAKGDQVRNPAKPIKITMQIQLVMEPQPASPPMASSKASPSQTH